TATRSVVVEGAACRAPAPLRQPSAATSPSRGGLSSALVVDVAQDPAALGNRLDELGPARRIAQLLAQLGDEYVDDLGLRLVVGAAVEMLQQHRPGDDIVAREGEQLEHPIFHLGNADRVAVDA